MTSAVHNINVKPRIITLLTESQLRPEYAIVSRKVQVRKTENDEIEHLLFFVQEETPIFC